MAPPRWSKDMLALFAVVLKKAPCPHDDGKAKKLLVSPKLHKRKPKWSPQMKNATLAGEGEAKERHELLRFAHLHFKS
ncbi:hypothetical protein GOBAR_DD36338 [Gossypium barbadense]|nr:hypothetical protein GOBAR_DD36338 [Gossypium barbadense]